MTDLSTQQPLRVSTDGDAIPYIIVLVKQLDDVCGLLDSNDVKYWVDAEAFSLNGEPEVTVINLPGVCNAAAVQDILDNAPSN